MRKLTAVIILSLFVLMAKAQKTFIWCGTLIDGVSNQAMKDKTIIIEKNIIIEVRDSYATGATGDKIIDLKTKTVMPGLMDMHVHLESETKKGGYADRFTMNPEDVAFQSAKYAETTLMSGFTTVRDLGGSGVNIALRNAVNKGLTIDPLIYSENKVNTKTGGNADPTNGTRKNIKTKS